LGKKGSPVGSRRSKPREDPRQARLKRLQSARTARHRARIDKGLMCAEQVEVSGLALDWLIATGFLRDEDAGDRVAVGKALTMLVNVSSLDWERRGRGCP